MRIDIDDDDGKISAQRAPAADHERPDHLAHRRVQAVALMVGTQILVAHSVAWHHALHRQHLLPGAWAEGNAVRARRGASAACVSRVMILCSSAGSSSSVGAGPATNTGSPSVRRYTPSSTRQCR